MKNVFIDCKGKMSLTQNPGSVMVGEIHRMQGRGAFADEIEIAEHNGMRAQDLTREWAYKATQSPYNSKSTIVYVDNIQPI